MLPSERSSTMAARLVA